MTNQEFTATRLGFQAGNGSTTPETNFRYEEMKDDFPTVVDWRDKGSVTRIKNQGLCVSCWAFAAVAAVEDLHEINTGKLMSLSEQELVDCDSDGGHLGCKGGLMEYAFNYIKENGLTRQRDYPYTGSDDSCDKNVLKKKSGAKIRGYEKVPRNDEKSLQAAVAHQPVSIAIDGLGFAMQLYSSGVFTGQLCGTKLNHAVTAVRYGEEDGRKYWIMKNSWGSRWSESGYMRITRDSRQKQGACRIAKMASYPVM